MTRLSIQFRVPPKEVEDLLFNELSSLLQKFSDKVNKKLPSLTTKFKELTRNIFTKGPMNRGLVSGRLAGEFGIPASDITETADKIIDIIIDNLFVSFNSSIRGRLISGSLKIQLLTKVYDDLTSSEFAEIITKKGDVLPWIDWSLFHGDEIIIEDYDVFFHVGSGRSGLAIMKKDYARSFWKVPSDVSGTENDNWISREIDKARAAYISLTEKSLSEILSSIL